MSGFIQGDIASDNVLDMLGRIIELGGETRPAHKSIARYMENQVIRGFKQSTDPWGTPWEPIKHRDGKPLIDNRILLSSIQSIYGDDFSEVGTNLVYGPIHQFGGRAGRNRKTTIGARPYLPIDASGVNLPPDWEESILGTLSKIVEGLASG